MTSTSQVDITDHGRDGTATPAAASNDTTSSDAHMGVCRGNTRRRAIVTGLVLGWGALVVLMLAGCDESKKQADTQKPKFEVADDSQAAESGAPATKGTNPANGESAAAKKTPNVPAAAPRKPPSIPGDQLDSSATIPVADGNVEQLLAQIDKLQKQYNALTKKRPPAAEESRLLGQLRAICDAEMRAADKVLDANPPVAQRRKAVNARLHAMRFLSLVAPQKSQVEDVRRFAQRIALDKDPEISLQGRVILLGLRIGDLRSNKTRDLGGLMNDLKALLTTKNREQSVLDVTQQAEMTLRMLGYEKEADEAFKAIAEAFKNHANPALAKEAANMFEELKLRTLGLDEKLDALARKEKGAAKPFLDAMRQAMTMSKPTDLMLNKALGALNMLEQTAQYSIGIQLCQIIKSAFDKTSDKQLKANADHAVDMALRRLQLVGKPLSLQGKTVDGAKFDFSKYKGKVVLVDFWATWCGPCVAELPNMEDNYQKYHAKGFDIIGVNLDQNRDAVTRFLTTHKLPWTTIVNNHLAEQCGVEAIPFILLLDQKGVVVALHVQGPQLGQKLAELLGPPAPSPAKPATNPGAKSLAKPAVPAPAPPPGAK